MKKPKFYKAVLEEIKGNVLDEVYPHLKGKGQLKMEDRLGSKSGGCDECGSNEWWLYPKESAAVREGGKPYIQCLNCGYITHL